MGMDMYINWEEDLADTPTFCSRFLAEAFDYELNRFFKKKGCYFFNKVAFPEDGEEPIFMTPEEFNKDYEKTIQIILADESFLSADGKENLIKELEPLKEIIQYAKKNNTKIGLSVC